MTGLDPQRHVILEIAVLVTDDRLQDVIEGPDVVVRQPASALAEMDDTVRAMHAASGLIRRVESSRTSLREAGETVLGFLRAHLDEPATVPLCGNSIGVDRRFLARHLPEIDGLLHYRCIDVSTVKELARRWRPSAYENAPEKAKSHRALDDIHESLEELRWYRRAGFFACDPAAR